MVVKKINEANQKAPVKSRASLTIQKDKAMQGLKVQVNDKLMSIKK